MRTATVVVAWPMRVCWSALGRETGFVRLPVAAEPDALTPDALTDVALTAFGADLATAAD